MRVIGVGTTNPTKLTSSILENFGFDVNFKVRDQDLSFKYEIRLVVQDIRKSLIIYVNE